LLLLRGRLTERQRTALLRTFSIRYVVFTAQFLQVNTPINMRNFTNASVLNYIRAKRNDYVKTNLHALVFILFHGSDAQVLSVDRLLLIILHHRILSDRWVELDRRAGLSSR
jgi:hypothetical protein